MSYFLKLLRVFCYFRIYLGRTVLTHFICGATTYYLRPNTHGWKHIIPPETPVDAAAAHRQNRTRTGGFTALFHFRLRGKEEKEKMTFNFDFMISQLRQSYGKHYFNPPCVSNHSWPRMTNSWLGMHISTYLQISHHRGVWYILCPKPSNPATLCSRAGRSGRVPNIQPNML